MLLKINWINRRKLDCLDKDKEDNFKEIDGEIYDCPLLI